MISLRTQRINQRADIFHGVVAVHRFLHAQVKILHAHADAVETQFAQVFHGTRADPTGMNLNGVFTRVIIHQIEVPPGSSHQPGHFVIADKGWRTAAPM